MPCVHLRPLASRPVAMIVGPGEDWVCTVDYVDTGQSSTQSFELQVKTDG